MLNLDRFRRITTGGPLLSEVDGLRFIAIASVTVLHVSSTFLQKVYGFRDTIDFDRATLPAVYRGHYWMFRLLSHGGRGVEIFFVISGFVLGWPLARRYILGANPKPVKDYYIRRLTRLEPPYIHLLVIRAGMMAGAGLFPLAVLWPHLLASLFYVHNFVYHESPLVSRVAWSLEIEVQFYCLAPLMAWLLFRAQSPMWRRLTMGALIVGAIAIQPRFGTWPAATLLGYLAYFLAGFLLADLYVSGWLDRRSWLFDLMIPAWALVFWFTEPTFRVIAPLLLLVLFVGAFKGRATKAFLQIPAFSIIGGMCYSIYLTHRAITAVIMPEVLHLHQGMIASTALTLIPVLILGAEYFLLIERPCMDKHWPSKLMAKLRTPAPSSEADGAA